MNEPPETQEESIQDQLIRAARDLMCAVYDSGDDFVLFMDRRRLNTRVQRESDGLYSVHWETHEGDWVAYDRRFENLREAAFHGYQGPH